MWWRISLRSSCLTDRFPELCSVAPSVSYRHSLGLGDGAIAISSTKSLWIQKGVGCMSFGEIRTEQKCSV